MKKKNNKKIIKNIMPLIAMHAYLKLWDIECFSVNCMTWSEVLSASSVYDVILSKAREFQLTVEKGEALYERDSMLFEKIQYSCSLLAGLLWVSSWNVNRLNTVDFGGSLGTTYYQNIRFLPHLDELRWSIVEQKKCEEYGKRDFENEFLMFYYGECSDERHPAAVLFLVILQYLKNSYELLKDIVGKEITYILFSTGYPFLKRKRQDNCTESSREVISFELSGLVLQSAKAAGFHKGLRLMGECDLADSFLVASLLGVGGSFLVKKRNRTMRAGNY